MFSKRSCYRAEQMGDRSILVHAVGPWKAKIYRTTDVCTFVSIWSLSRP